MRAPLVALAVGGVLALTGPGIEPVRGQAARSLPEVGIPGCTDDIAVQASRESIRFDSRGRSIRAHLYTPRGPANGMGLVLLHGGTGFEMNAILFDAHAIQLASRGYRVLLPAYFDAARPDQSRRTVTARAWRQAALDAAEALQAEPGVAPGQVALWGYSRGAGVAVDAATGPGGRAGRIILAAGGGSTDGALEGRALSALLLHARRDEAVPVRSTLALAEDLRGLGAAVEVQGLDFDGHQYDLRTWCDAFRRTRAFMESDRPAGRDEQETR